MRLQGKKAVVTAAGSGIGRTCALAFAAEGAEVLAVDLDHAALGTLAAEARGIRTLQADVTNAAHIERIVVEARAPDILVNAVGIVPGGSVLDANFDEFNRAWDVNVVSMLRTIRAVLPSMIERGVGSIVNISSVASSITGVQGRCAYGVTKAAVIGLTKSVAADYVAKGVRCNAVCPGTVDTPSLRARAQAQPDPDAAMARFRARQPMNRLGSSEEIAAAVLFLSSDESGFVTGQCLVVDGGWTM